MTWINRALAAGVIGLAMYWPGAAWLVVRSLARLHLWDGVAAQIPSLFDLPGGKR